MSDCIDGIIKEIISNCTTSVGGSLEVKAWIFNRKDLSVTFDPENKRGQTSNKVIDLALPIGKSGFQIQGIKKLLNAGHDRVVAEDRPDKFTHYFALQQFETTSQDIFNVDNLSDLVVFVESKDKKDDGDGVLIGYGVRNGLYVTTDSQRANDINGARNLELASAAGEEEAHSRYILLKDTYADSIALLDSLLVIQN
jgi:hypothetical protein